MYYGRNRMNIRFNTEIIRIYNNIATPKPKADSETHKAAPNKTQKGFNTKIKYKIKWKGFRDHA